MSTYSPLITPEDISQERELMRLQRPERFTKWRVSRASVVNELLRREHGRRMQRSAPEPLQDREPRSREAERSPLELAELRSVLLSAIAKLTPQAQRIAARIAKGRTEPRANLRKLRAELAQINALPRLAEHL